MGRAFEARLGTPAPEKSVSLFGGALVETAAALERWYLLWGLERFPIICGHSRQQRSSFRIPLV